MRGYYLPMAAGLTLVVSAFMPWALLGDVRLGGMPDLGALWILGLGLLAILLATLSIITRKNSRHPLLLVGLAAFGILLLSERLMERVAEDRVWVATQATAIVAGQEAYDTELPDARMAAGAYVGLTAAGVIVLFGLTIVVRRASSLYAVPTDDD
jgi:hypothetical protein